MICFFANLKAQYDMTQSNTQCVCVHPTTFYFGKKQLCNSNTDHNHGNEVAATSPENACQFTKVMFKIYNSLLLETLNCIHRCFVKEMTMALLGRSP